MINYEEELKKFHPSLDVNEAEDAIYNRDFTDVTDILKELINDEKKKKQKSLNLQNWAISSTCLSALIPAVCTPSWHFPSPPFWKQTLCSLTKYSV